MQIVIDIPEHAYEECKKIKFCEELEGVPFHVISAVRNGIVLPEKHGRLIDANALQIKYCDDNCGKRKCVDAMDRCVFIDAILEAPTIIERVED